MYAAVLEASPTTSATSTPEELRALLFKRGTVTTSGQSPEVKGCSRSVDLHVPDGSGRRPLQGGTALGLMVYQKGQLKESSKLVWK